MKFNDGAFLTLAVLTILYSFAENHFVATMCFIGMIYFALNSKLDKIEENING